MSLHKFHIEQEISLIEEDILQKNWGPAVKKCQKALINFKEQNPPEIYVLMSMASRSQGAIEVAAKIIEQGLTIFPGNPIILLEKMELAKPAEKWREADKYLRLIQKNIISQGKKPAKYRKENQSNKTFESLKVNINPYAFEEEDPESLQAYHRVMHNILDQEDILATGAYKLLLRGKFDRAGQAFLSLLNNINLPLQAKKTWIDAFYELSSIVAHLGYGQKIDSQSKPLNSLGSDNQPDFIKIISSGMGWSGSGALTAYLREFHDVDYVQVSELCHLDGPFGLVALQSFKGGTDEYITFILNLFAFTLFGFGVPCETAGLYDLERSKLKTRKLLQSPAYARGVRIFLNHARFMHRNSDGIDSQIFIKAANILLDSICQSFARKEPRFVLLDNILHIQELRMIEVFKNTQIICVYRDPRSNYVALVKEDWKRSRTIRDKGPAAYCKFYRRVRKKAELSINNLAVSKNKVQNIQFEQFISSERFREDLARGQGLNPHQRNKHKFFKPWQSLENIDNYKRYADKYEIRTIENIIPEYLYPA